MESLGLRPLNLRVRKGDGAPLTSIDLDAIRLAVSQTRAFRLMDEPNPMSGEGAKASGHVDVALVAQTNPRGAVEEFSELIRNSNNLVVEDQGTDWLNRILVLVLGLVAMAAALSHNRVIFTFVLYAWSALGAAFGPVLILALSWGDMTKAGALAGMIAGAAVTVIWKNVPALSGIVYELVPAFLCAFAVAVLASLLSRQAKVRNGRR